MQLGARWRVAEKPHRSVPPELYSAIAEQEAAHPSAASWTLTFLEGRPRCALEDLVIVTLDPAGAVKIERLDTSSSEEDSDDDWLS